MDLTGQLGKRDKGEVDLFAPLMQDDRSLLFLDGRGKLFNEGVKEGNVGLGYRRMMDGGWNLGGYGFFDLRRSENDNTFSQVTVGAEALSLDWDLRVNGYLPLRERAGVSSSVTGELSGGGIVVRHRRSDELAFRGLDAEVGWRAPVFAPDADRQLRLFAGGYYFDHGDADEVTGPRGRVEYRMHDLGFLGAGSRLTLSGEVQRDAERGVQGFVAATLRIPFQGFGDRESRRRSNLTARERRMTDPVIRDVDIVSLGVVTVNDEPAVNTVTGRLFGAATVVDARNDITTVTGALGPNAVLIADGGLGQFAVVDPLVLGDGRVLMGGGGRLEVRGVRSGVVATFTAPGTRPVISDPNNRPVVTVRSNTQLIGVDLEGGGAGNNNYGVRSDGAVSRVAVRDLRISDVGADGIRFDDASTDVTISGNTILNAGDDGILVEDLSSNVTVSGNTITNPGDEGIIVGAGVSNVTVSANAISDTPSYGIRFEIDATSATISGNTISNTGNDGILMRDNATNATVTGNTLSNVAAAGVRINANAANTTVSNNSITGAADYGILFETGATDITVSGNTVTNVTRFDGIFMDNSARRVAVGSNTVSNVDDYGIRIGTGARDIALSDNVISNVTQFDGIFVANTALNVTATGNTISNTGDEGISVDLGASNVTLRANAISNAVGNGMFVGSGGANVTVDANTITDVDGHGVQVDDGITGVTVTGNTISDVALVNGIPIASSNGIELGNNATNATISGNTLSLISNRGITAGSSATNVTVSGNTISDNNGFGVAFGTSAAGVTVSGNTISGGSTGVDFSSGASTVTISGNTISDVSFDGVQVSGLSTSVTVSGNVFQGAIGVDLIGLLGGDYAGDNNRNETTSIGGVVCDDTRSGDIYGPGPGIAITGEATRCGVPGVRP